VFAGGEDGVVDVVTQGLGLITAGHIDDGQGNRVCMGVSVSVLVFGGFSTVVTVLVIVVAVLENVQ
jgi:hypothetical protein